MDSIAVFSRGYMNNQSGHVAWVTGVHGSQIDTISMNDPTWNKFVPKTYTVPSDNAKAGAIMFIHAVGRP